MKSIQKYLKPNVFTFMIVIFLWAIQLLIFTHQITTIGGNSPSVTQTCLGMGSPVIIRYVESGWSLVFNWPVLFLNLSACYLIAGFLSFYVLKRILFRRLLRGYFITAAIACPIIFLLAITFSKAYWDYYLIRPSLLTETHTIAQVNKVILIATEVDNLGRRNIIVNRDDVSLAEKVTRGLNDSYYCLDERILVHLDKQNLLPDMDTRDLSDFPDLFSQINRTGLLAKPDSGYKDSDLLKGVLVDATDNDGHRLVFIGVTGGQLSNDHYPYYEMIFREVPETQTLTYSRGQHFFYDVAGFEGFGAFPIFISLTMITLIVFLPLITGIMIMDNRSEDSGSQPIANANNL